MHCRDAHVASVWEMGWDVSSLGGAAENRRTQHSRECSAWEGGKTAAAGSVGSAGWLLAQGFIFLSSLLGESCRGATVLHDVPPGLTKTWGSQGDYVYSVINQVLFPMLILNANQHNEMTSLVIFNFCNLMPDFPFTEQSFLLHLSLSWFSKLERNCSVIQTLHKSVLQSHKQETEQKAEVGGRAAAIFFIWI